MSGKRFVTHDSFGTKLRGKHGELEHKKAIRDVLLLTETIFDKRKTR